MALYVILKEYYAITAAHPQNNRILYLFRWYLSKYNGITITVLPQNSFAKALWWNSTSEPCVMTNVGQNSPIRCIRSPHSASTAGSSSSDFLKQRSADKASSSFIYWCTSLNLLCLISLLLGASGARSCVTFTGVLFNKRDSDFLLKICSFDQSVFKGYFIGKKMKVEGYSVAGGLKRATENHPTTLHMTSSIQEF